jgi:hypothetical protein
VRTDLHPYQDHIELLLVPRCGSTGPDSDVIDIPGVQACTCHSAASRSTNNASPVRHFRTPNGLAETGFRLTYLSFNRQAFRFNVIAPRGGWWTACILRCMSTLKPRPRVHAAGGWEGGESGRVCFLILHRGLDRNTNPSGNSQRTRRDGAISAIG